MPVSPVPSPSPANAASPLPEGSYSSLRAGDLAALPGYPTVFHVAPRSRVADIWAHGLRPGNLTRDADRMNPRPDCVYFGSVDLLHEGWLHEWTGLRDADGDTPGTDLILAVDVSAIDPRRVLPDEDAFHLVGGHGFTGPLWSQDSEVSQGQWADDVRLGEEPGVSAAAILSRQTLAVRGALPREVLSVHAMRGYRSVRLGPLSGWASAEDLLAALVDADREHVNALD